MTTKARAYSRPEKHSIEFTWEIGEITSFINSARTANTRIYLTSPKFTTGAKIKDSWFLRLQLRDSQSSKTKSWIGLYFHGNNGNHNVQVKYRFFLLNNKKEKVGQNFTRYNNLFNPLKDKFYIGSASRGYNFVKIDKLLEKKQEFLDNDTLIVGIDLIVFDDYLGVDNRINSLIKSSKRKLTDDFEDLFTAKKKCDIKIQVGRKIFDAHKLVLSTRSCVFDAMFSHNMKERKKNKVNIPDVDPEVFEKILQFIYTDKVDDLDNFAEQLLEVSDKYQLQTLKELCEDSIAKTLSVENSIRILVLADRHNAKQLVEHTLNYTVINLDILKYSEEYQELEEFHPSLFLAVLKKHVNKR